MNDEKIRQYLAFIVFGVYVFLFVFVFVVIIIGFMDVNSGIDLLKTMSGIFSGFIGVIIGYYFSKK
jgi:hypothetical protein